MLAAPRDLRPRSDVRSQQLMPHAANVPDISTVVFRRPDSRLETYGFSSVNSGLPLVAVGKYITPGAAASD